jgi:hypothetical protein
MRPSYQFSIGAIMFWIGVVAIVLTFAAETHDVKQFLIGMALLVLVLWLTSRNQIRLALSRSGKGASDASAKRAPDSRHLSSDYSDAGRMAGRLATPARGPARSQPR